MVSGLSFQRKMSSFSSNNHKRAKLREGKWRCIPPRCYSIRCCCVVGMHQFLKWSAPNLHSNTPWVQSSKWTLWNVIVCVISDGTTFHCCANVERFRGEYPIRDNELNSCGIIIWRDEGIARAKLDLFALVSCFLEIDDQLQLLEWQVHEVCPVGVHILWARNDFY